jgi:hypothetical protein
MAAETRFNLDDILGNEVVDFAVLDANQQILGNNAAHLSLGNSFTGMQEVHRPAAGNPALQVRLDADVTPRLTITADGAINWAATSISAAAGVLTIGGTTLRTPSLQTAAGTAAAPAQSFTTDTGTGFFSPSSGVLGVAVGGVETNRVSNQGEIRFNRTNARISAYTTDDPATPGERLVNINALTVTPGRLYAASLTVNGNSQVSGNEVVTGTLSVSGQGTFTGVLQAGGAINAYGGMVHFEASNVVNIQWRGDLAALYIPYGNGIYTTSGVFTGNINVSGTASVGGRLVVGGYDAGWQVNLASGSTGVITNGRFYQRGNGGYYCYDAGDFAYGVGIASSTLVQRDGAGQIQTQGVYMPSAAQGGRPAYVVGQTGDGWMHWWPASAIGPPASVTHLATQSSVPNGPDGWSPYIVSLTANRTGQWLVAAFMTRGTYTAGVGMSTGSTQGFSGYFWNLDQGSSSWAAAAGDWWQGFLSVGQVVQAQGARATQFTPGTIYFHMWFIPTADYPG